VTSQGHAYTRFRNALEQRRSATTVRAAAAELPAGVPLEDALEVVSLCWSSSPRRSTAPPQDRPPG
jgi:hypothetical protein